MGKDLTLKLAKGKPRTIKIIPANLIKFSGAIKITPIIPGNKNIIINIFLLVYKNKSLLTKILINKKNKDKKTKNFAIKYGEMVDNIINMMLIVSTVLFLIFIIFSVLKILKEDLRKIIYCFFSLSIETKCDS